MLSLYTQRCYVRLYSTSTNAALLDNIMLTTRGLRASHEVYLFAPHVTNCPLPTTFDVRVHAFSIMKLN